MSLNLNYLWSHPKGIFGQNKTQLCFEILFLKLIDSSIVPKNSNYIWLNYFTAAKQP